MDISNGLFSLPSSNSLQIWKCPRYCDERGYLISTYQEYTNYPVKFIEHRVSVSHKYVLRGLHTDFTTSKLITLLFGKIRFVAVNLDQSAIDYRIPYIIKIDSKDEKQIFVPPTYANGHLCLSDDCVLDYKWDEYYNLDKQITVKWDDPTLGIDWGIENPILSDRDKSGQSLLKIKRNV